ncbi:hypothetical protein AaE_010950 [Aphanomyces astaci]|uniref:Uncharacterized protein n=1 Tax=Aphanomyces astaci TaxID=112090 RepID=A0A6A4ZMS3_APHAT|nr:hypothetical protein AaE_010950 [Aphanomyces astaci]
MQGRSTALGIAQAAIALGTAVYFPRWYGSFESSHPEALEVAVVMLGVLTFAVLAITTPPNIHGNKLLGLAFGIGATAMGAVCSHVIIVFFGAPVFQLSWKTFLLALVVSILTVPHVALHFRPSSSGASPYIDLLLHAKYRNASELQMAWTSIGTVFGAYIGTVFIPLDWDRPWQQWPLPCVYGALYGHVVGIALSVVVAFTGASASFGLVQSKRE